MAKALSFDPGPGKMLRSVAFMDLMKSGTDFIEYFNEGRSTYYEKVDECRYEDGTVAYLVDKQSESGKRWLAVFKNGAWMDSDSTLVAESILTSPDNLTVVEVLGNVNV